MNLPLSSSPELNVSTFNRELYLQNITVCSSEFTGTKTVHTADKVQDYFLAVRNIQDSYVCKNQYAKIKEFGKQSANMIFFFFKHSTN